MIVEQFVMAYKVEQDRIRAILPNGFDSLRPVLRINAEILGDGIYIEFNTPVSHGSKKGWLNISCWRTPEDGILIKRDGASVTFMTDFLEITYKGVGIEGGCPEERDNDGCYYFKGDWLLVPPERITEKKEFCDCSFKWNFNKKSTGGISIGGRILPVVPSEPEKNYPREVFTPEAFAAIPCEQMLGQYKVIFERTSSDLRQAVPVPVHNMGI